jgi:hypothetical protein
VNGYPSPVAPTQAMSSSRLNIALQEHAGGVAQDTIDVDTDLSQPATDRAAAEVAPVSEAKAPPQKNRPSPPAVTAGGVVQDIDVDTDLSQPATDRAAAEVAPVSEAKAPPQKKRPSPPAVTASAPHKKRAEAAAAAGTASAAAAAEGSQATGFASRCADEWGPGSTARCWPPEIRKAAAVQYGSAYHKTLRKTKDRNQAVLAARKAKQEYLHLKGIRWRSQGKELLGSEATNGPRATAKSAAVRTVFSSQEVEKRRLFASTKAALKVMGKPCSGSDIRMAMSKIC